MNENDKSMNAKLDLNVSFKTNFNKICLGGVKLFATFQIGS